MKIRLLFALFVAVSQLACGGEDAAVASIRNGFDDPSADRQPPWTFCETRYNGVDFGRIAFGAESEAREVQPGFDFVLMVASFGDPGCPMATVLPLASRVREETVAGQRRTITIDLPNHQGPCPPMGIQPLPEETYERIRSLWPEFEFEPYASRADNGGCAP
ncbi:MAG TPA: hypothetical protein RMG48_12155 [Myxococcales bacterium LLY-WYZ-16_1]|nr:hypothetical protein [Myxococcales bacterium LLY-WYZ-16_1]